MGNRSRYVAATAAATAAALASAERRARLRRAFEGVRDTIMSTHVVDLPTELRPQGDEAHAPGHRHLGAGSVRGKRRRGGARRPARYADGMRHRISDQ